MRVGMSVGIMVVLWFCATANGYLVELVGSTHDLNMGDTMTLVLVSLSDEEYEVHLRLSRPDMLQAIGPVTVCPAAGADAWAMDLTDEGQPGWWYLCAAGDDPTMPVPGAVHFEIQYYATGVPGVAEFELYDMNGEWPFSTWYVIYDIPEPMSVITFGFVGTCLLRRRRAVARYAKSCRE